LEGPGVFAAGAALAAAGAGTGDVLAEVLAVTALRLASIISTTLQLSVRTDTAISHAGFGALFLGSFGAEYLSASLLSALCRTYDVSLI
jgi:hypothetical protein